MYKIMSIFCIQSTIDMKIMKFLGKIFVLVVQKTSNENAVSKKYSVVFIVYDFEYKYKNGT